jgi:hypothetical protein
MANVAALSGFLSDASTHTFRYGHRDCLLWLCDWARVNGWPDPGAHWRGTYVTARQCWRIVKREGGLVSILAKGMASVGVPRLLNPADALPGDIGVGYMGAPTDWGDETSLGLIRTRVGYAALTQGGLLVGPAKLWAAWRV